MANFFRSILLRLQNKSVTAGTSDTSVSADSGYDGLGTVTVSPTPSETKTQAAGTSNIDVTPTSGKLLSKVTVTPTPTETGSCTPSTTAQTITPSSGKYLSSVSVSAIQTQTKSATPSTTAQTITPDSGKYLTSVSVGAISTETKTQAAGTSNIDVTPTSGKYLTKVTITPQQHSGYYPSSSTNITSNGTSDLGASHNYRYIKVNVPAPTLSGDAAKANVLSGKTFYNTSTTKQTGTMTNNGAFEGDIDPSRSTTYELSPGYYSSIRIDVLPHTEYSPSSSTYTQLAMGESKSIDLGQHHKYRYVRVEADAPSGTKSISANGTGIDVTSYASVNVRVPNPTLSGDAATGNVLSGKTFYNSDYTKRTGTMANNGDGSATLNCGGSKVLSAGYYSGGTISANSLASQTGVDSGKTAIDASHVHSGYQGWVNGSKVSGTYSPPTINSIVPKDSAPPSMSVGSNYSPTKTGYVYETIHTVPSGTLEATANANGTTSVGVEAYSTLSLTVAVPNTPYFQETEIWKNTSSTSSFDTQDVTLTQSIDNFEYIKIKVASDTSHQTSAYCVESIYAKADVRKASTSTYGIQLGISAKPSSNRYCARRITYVSDTKLNFSSALQMSGTNTTNTSVIPLSIVGLKLAVQ